MPPERSHYETLGVRHDASPETIRDAYRRAVVASHPDTGSSDADREWRQARTAELNVAYGVLKDPAKRADYDDRLRALLRVADVDPDTTTPERRPPPVKRERGRSRPLARRRFSPRLEALYGIVSSPFAGWLLFGTAGFLGNWFGGLERAIDAAFWAGLAHFLIRPSSKSPLAVVVVGALRFIEGLIVRR